MVTITVEEKEFIEQTIKQCKECFVGMIDTEGLPYVIPMNFGYKDEVVYLHSGAEGSAIRAIGNNPQVCITFCTPSEITHQNEEVACSYRVRGRSVVCRGKVIFVEDFDEKIAILNILMEQYTDQPFRYSEPAVKNVKIWKVPADELTARVFGVPYKESHQYKEINVPKADL